MKSIYKRAATATPTATKRPPAFWAEAPLIGVRLVVLDDFPTLTEADGRAETTLAGAVDPAPETPLAVVGYGAEPPGAEVAGFPETAGAELAGFATDEAPTAGAELAGFPADEAPAVTVMYEVTADPGQYATADDGARAGGPTALLAPLEAPVVTGGETAETVVAGTMVVEVKTELVLEPTGQLVTDAAHDKTVKYEVLRMVEVLGAWV